MAHRPQIFGGKDETAANNQERVADGADPEQAARLQAVVEKMTASYLEWVEGDLETLSQTVEMLTTEKDEALPYLEKIYRAAHDIKGQGGSFGYPLMTEAGSLLCKYIEHMTDVTETDLRMISLCVRTMHKIIYGRHSGEGGIPGQALKDEMQPAKDVIEERRVD